METTGRAAFAQSAMVDIEFINTNKGIHAIHRHQDDDPRFCVGWRRIGPGYWRQRHLKGYTARCGLCGHKMPSDAELEAVFSEVEKKGIDTLLYIEVIF